MARYQVRLLGEHARLGEIPASDVGKLLIGIQRVIARAAGVALRRRPKTTGRWEAAIEEAARVRLVELRAGSVIVELEPPSQQPSADELDLPVESLGDLGWDFAMRAIAEPDEADTDVVLRLSQLADEIGIGDRYEALEFKADGSPTRRLDRAARWRFKSVLEERRQTAAPSAVAGLLVEADFEKKTAHVRTPSGQLVELLFEDEQADVIYEALRQRSEFKGDVTYDPVTQAIRSVRIRRVVRTEQLLLGDDATAFWRKATAEQLISEQGKGPVLSFAELRDDSLSDEEFADLLETLE